MNVRSANHGEAALLGDVALAAKSHWGYSEAFLEAARRSLSIPDAAIAAGHVFVLEDDAQVVGFFGFEGEPPTGVLE